MDFFDSIVVFIMAFLWSRGRIKNRDLKYEIECLKLLLEIQKEEN